jgi:hypothetical protein
MCVDGKSIWSEGVICKSVLMFTLIDILPWLERHMLPCPSKKFLHIECPGCGIQRSVLALFQGDFVTSFLLYPATIPIIAMLLYTFLHVKFKFINGARNLKIFQLICAIIIVVNYIHKLLNQN